MDALWIKKAAVCLRENGRFPHPFRRQSSVIGRLFAYDASGQRVMTVEPSGKTTYFPFPGYSEEMVGTSVTARCVTYTIAGQAVASRVQTFSPAANTLYRLYTDHLGSTVTQSTMSGGTVAGTNTYYLPYGSYRGTPPKPSPTATSPASARTENLACCIIRQDSTCLPLAALPQPTPSYPTLPTPSSLIGTPIP